MDLFCFEKDGSLQRFERFPTHSASHHPDVFLRAVRKRITAFYFSVISPYGANRRLPVPFGFSTHRRESPSHLIKIAHPPEFRF